MKKRYLAVSLLLSSACGIACAEGEQRSAKPNVIIIYADDLGYGDLSCYGAKSVETPSVDRLAAEGIRFTNVHAVAATSTPSRYSLLTGEYAWRRSDTDIAAGNAGMIIRPGQFTMADMFKSAGYATAAVGKWHLGLGSSTGAQDWNAPLPEALGDLGFDYHYIMAATADRVPCVFIENGLVANYDPSAPIEVSYTSNFPGEPTGKDNPELLFNLRSSHGHDQSIVNGIGRIGYMRGGGTALWKDENIADSITAHAVRFIRQHEGEPFFLYFATNDVHVPRFPNERFRGTSPMGLRGDAILQFDWSVGQVLETLDELGLADNTLVILSSDNGPVLDDGYRDQAVELVGDHLPAGPWRGWKYSAFEGGTVVPAIVRWPASVPAGEESDALMSQIDWLRSLGSLLGARFPEGSAPDSHDRLATLLGKDTADRPYVIELSSSHARSVRTRQWKYIEPNEGGRLIVGPNVETGNSPLPQLYDMQHPYEEANVASEHPDIVSEMQEILQQEQER